MPIYLLNKIILQLNATQMSEMCDLLYKVSILAFHFFVMIKEKKTETCRSLFFCLKFSPSDLPAYSDLSFLKDTFLSKIRIRRCCICDDTDPPKGQVIIIIICYHTYRPPFQKKSCLVFVVVKSLKILSNKSNNQNKKQKQEQKRT